MRIIGEINDLPFKVTALEMNNRVSIKFEDGNQEITLKFRDGSAICNFKDVQDFVSQKDTIEKMESIFKQIALDRRGILQDMMNAKGIDFPTII